MNLLDFLFPKRCVGCKIVGTYFCKDCILEIAQTELVCPFCERASIGGVVHPGCKRRFGLDGLWSLGIYQNPLREAIKKLKYKWVKELALDLVNLTLDYWARYQPYFFELIKKDQGKNWLIVPVPLHFTRQNWRGFNQAALLSKLFAAKMGLEYQEALKRVRSTKPQVGQLSFDRRQNIKGAFALTGQSIKGVNVLLVDDVWTTGSTLKECCYVLKRGGAKQVRAITLAR
ncbi:ComF family protein [Candidatus Daviesbacteria bacterium]|nr:ComF family protein [Candidatus Daviesbacteria bacterium]